MIYPWLAPCGSSPDYLHVCYFTETAQGNVRIRLCVTIIFKYFCVCGKGQILKISLQLGLLSTLKKKRLRIHLSFIQLQTHLVLFISFKFILSKINLNVSSFLALPTSCSLHLIALYFINVERPLRAQVGEKKALKPIIFKL